MWIAEKWQDYELLDCGVGEKLERWDKQYLVRPAPRPSGRRLTKIPPGSGQTPGISAPRPAAATGRKRPCRRVGRSTTES